MLPYLILECTPLMHKATLLKSKFHVILAATSDISKLMFTVSLDHNKGHNGQLIYTI